MDSKGILASVVRLLEEHTDIEDIKTKIDKPELLFRTNPGNYIEKIKELKRLLEEPTKFNVNDIVVWKDGLRNRKYPSYNQPCIVLKIHETPLKDDDTEIGDLYDMQIGLSIVDEDDGEDVFLIFNVSSSRYALYKPEDTK